MNPEHGFTRREALQLIAESTLYVVVTGCTNPRQLIRDVVTPTLHPNTLSLPTPLLENTVTPSPAPASEPSPTPEPTPVPSPTPDIKGLAQTKIQELAQAQNLSLKDLKIVISENPDKRSATAFLQSLTDPSLGWIEKGGKLVEIKAPTGASSLVWDFASSPLRGGALAALGPDGQPYIWLGKDNTDPTRTCWVDKEGKNYNSLLPQEIFQILKKYIPQPSPPSFSNYYYYTDGQRYYPVIATVERLYPGSKTMRITNMSIFKEVVAGEITFSYTNANIGMARSKPSHQEYLTDIPDSEIISGEDITLFVISNTGIIRGVMLRRKIP